MFIKTRSTKLKGSILNGNSALKCPKNKKLKKIKHRDQISPLNGTCELEARLYIVRCYNLLRMKNIQSYRRLYVYRYFFFFIPSHSQQRLLELFRVVGRFVRTIHETLPYRVESLNNNTIIRVYSTAAAAARLSLVARHHFVVLSPRLYERFWTSIGSENTRASRTAPRPTTHDSDSSHDRFFF